MTSYEPCDRNIFMAKPEPLEAEDGGVELSVEKLEVGNTIGGTSNILAPGTDGISYRFIKIVLNTKPGREMIRSRCR